MYRLALPNSMHTIHLVFYVLRLAKYRTDGQCQQPPPPTKLEDKLIYEVEKILDKRTCKICRRNHIEHLIHWRGYDYAHNNWKLVRNLQNYQESV